MFLLICEEKLEADVKENLTLVKSHFIYFFTIRVRGKNNSVTHKPTSRQKNIKMR